MLAMYSLFIVFSVAAATTNENAIQGEGTYFPLLSGWAKTYSDPNLRINFNITSDSFGMRAIIDKTQPYIDFAYIDSTPPIGNATTNNNYQLFPVVSYSIVPQFNIPEIVNFEQQLVLSEQAIAGIYMGNITKWNDPLILATNSEPLKSALPNTTIMVIYCSTCDANLHLTTVLSSFSLQWMSAYGTSLNHLQTLPNFIDVPDMLNVNAKILTTLNSFGYTSFGLTTRDPNIDVACIYNKYNVTVCPNTTNIAAAVATITLDKSLWSNSFAIDTNLSNAWSSGSYVYFIVPTQLDSTVCAQTRLFYQFLKWALTDGTAKNFAILSGYAPLSPNVRDYVISVLQNIQCDGQSLFTLTSPNDRNNGHEIVLILNSVFLFFIACLSVAHFYLFRSTTIINELYTIIFFCGAGITLSAPYVWYMIPDSKSVCLGRAWLTSMGLTLLLGTIFCRTWQLRDIYNLQKKATLEKMQSNISVRSSIIKLFSILCTIMGIDLFILITWTVTDPYLPIFVPANSEFLSQWKCSSNHMGSWMGWQVLLLSILICFGVYVIYRTWAFQRSALIRETRWVLMVLYNIVLNVVAAFPSAVSANSNDQTLSLIVMVSLLFSGGGIVLAFLLPRVLRKIRKNKERKDENPHRGSIESSSDKTNSPLTTPYPTQSSLQDVHSKIKLRGRELASSSIDSPPQFPVSHGTSMDDPTLSMLRIAPPTPHAGPMTLSSSPDESVSESRTDKVDADFLARPRRTKFERKGLIGTASREILLGQMDEENPRDLDSSVSHKPNTDETVHLTLPSRLERTLCTPSTEDRLLDPIEPDDITPLPNPTSWSSNPLVGTEESTPMEDI